MKVITHEDILNLHISPLQCYKWVDEALRKKGEEAIILPPKISMKPFAGSFVNVMPCVTDQSAGVKVVTRFPGRDPSLESYLMLFDRTTGKALAMMSADFITTMRTGAVAAHSIMLLAKKDFRTVAVMGLGCVTYATMQVLLALYPQRALHIKVLRYKNQHIEFIERFQCYSHLTFEVVNTPDELANDSDVIISGVTYLPDDVCSDASFSKGVLLVPIHTQGFKNCDLFFDKVFGDDYSHIKGFKYFSQFHSFAEVADVLAGKAKGRENDEERIIAYNIGISLHDTYFAEKIYDLLKDNLQLSEIDLKPPKEKMWLKIEQEDSQP